MLQHEWTLKVCKEASYKRTHLVGCHLYLVRDISIKTESRMTAALDWPGCPCSVLPLALTAGKTGESRGGWYELSTHWLTSFWDHSKGRACSMSMDSPALSPKEASLINHKQIRTFFGIHSLTRTESTLIHKDQLNKNPRNWSRLQTSPTGLSGASKSAPTTSQEPTVCISSQLHVQWHQVDRSKLGMAGGCAPQKLANTSNQVYLPPPRSLLLNIHPHTTGKSSFKNFH